MRDVNPVYFPCVRAPRNSLSVSYLNCSCLTVLYKDGLSTVLFYLPMIQDRKDERDRERERGRTNGKNGKKEGKKGGRKQGKKGKGRKEGLRNPLPN